MAKTEPGTRHVTVTIKSNRDSCLDYWQQLIPVIQEHQQLIEYQIRLKLAI